MINRILLTLVFASFSSAIWAQLASRPSGARSAGLGHASLTLDDGWSVLNNPGTLGWSKAVQLGVAYENRFFLPEVGLKSVGLSMPLGGGSIGLSGASYGYSSYSDNRFGLSYGRKLNDFISLGVQLNYLLVNIGDVYGSRSNLAGEIGMLVKPTESLYLAAHVFNPTRQKLAEFDDERFPTKLGIGVRYDFSEKVRMLADVEKSLTLPVDFQMGVEYAPLESLHLRAGFATLSSSFSFGLGYAWKSVSLDIANHWDQQLGFGATAAFGLKFIKQKEQRVYHTKPESSDE